MTRRGRERGGRGPGREVGGADALLGLGEMAFDSFGAIRAVYCSIGIGESRPAGTVAGFDGSEPGGLDRKACSSMEVVDKSANAG